MKKRILSLMACAAILAPTSGVCMEVEENENESKWYRFRVKPTTEALTSWELGISSKKNKLYCKALGKEKIEITASNNLAEGLDPTSFRRILQAMNDVKDPQRSNVAVKQEEEDEDETNFSVKRQEEGHETPLSIYSSYFTKITPQDKEKLFCHLLMKDYIQPGHPLVKSSDIKSEVWRTRKSALAENPTYHVGTLNATYDNCESLDKKTLNLSILYNTLFCGEKSFNIYLQEVKAGEPSSIIPLGEIHANVQPKTLSTQGIAFTKTSISIPSSVEEGIFLMTSTDILGHLDWRMEPVTFSEPYMRFIHRGLEIFPDLRNNDFPVKLREGSNITLEVKYHTIDYGASFLDLYVDEIKE